MSNKRFVDQTAEGGLFWVLFDFDYNGKGDIRTGKLFYSSKEAYEEEQRMYKAYENSPERKERERKILYGDKKILDKDGR